MIKSNHIPRIHHVQDMSHQSFNDLNNNNIPICFTWMVQQAGILPMFLMFYLYAYTRNFSMDGNFRILISAFLKEKPLDFSRDEKTPYFAPTATRAGFEPTTLRSPGHP